MHVIEDGNAIHSVIVFSQAHVYIASCFLLLSSLRMTTLGIVSVCFGATCIRSTQDALLVLRSLVLAMCAPHKAVVLTEPLLMRNERPIRLAKNWANWLPRYGFDSTRP